VLNEPVWDEHTGSHESPLTPADVVLTQRASVAVRRANDAGLPVVVVSNQPSAAKAVVDLSTIYLVHDQLLSLLGEEGAVIDRSFLCLHHPRGVDPALTQLCDCRKPAPGMLQEAAQELDLDLASCWMIGDTDADLGAARAAGLAGVVLVEHPLSAHRRTVLSDSADGRVTSISEAMDLVLQRIL
jgi:D-glycero-D-manno-heptose 1,7-bisphosphate phosphatase